MAKKNGIGLNDWIFEVEGDSGRSAWRYLVKDIKGVSDNEPAWNLKPDYQRGPKWSPEQQSLFIGHVLSGGLCPRIYVQRSHEPGAVPEVIDGQQRLRAITAFIEGAIPATVWLEDEWRDFWYEEMSTPEKRHMCLASDITFVDLSRVDRMRFYLRLNAGVPHTKADLDKVRDLIRAEVDYSV